MNVTGRGRPPPVAQNIQRSSYQKFITRIISFFWASLTILFCFWVAIDSLSPHLPNQTEPPKLYSNQTQQDLRLTLVESIRKASESIHLVMFGLSDPAILGALAGKKIPMTIYYDPTGSPMLWNVLPKAKLYPVRSYGLMHQKILVIDRDLIYIGSANMTTASLTMHDNLVIGLKSRRLADFLIEKTPQSPGYIRTQVGGQDIEMWLLPDPRGHALQALKKKIRSARKTLKIALFTCTHPSLVSELIEAHKRGVFVDIVIDLHSSLGASKKAVEDLKASGVQVSVGGGLELLHHKFLIIDNQTLITGSANWTKAAFYKNSDCIIALNYLTPEQKTFSDKLWARIKMQSQDGF